MIEVEKKCILKEGDEARLISGADFISEKTFTDTYFDDAEYSLGKKDTWLRKRVNQYELKIAFVQNGIRMGNQYTELETEAEIADALQLKTTISFEDAMREKGYMSFCSITTTRRKYKKGEIIIDIDSMDFGYEMAEIEIMVDAPEKVEGANQSIIAFAAERGITIGGTNGKVVEYLKRFDTKRYEALIDVGVIRRK